MTDYYGDIAEDATIRIPFNTFDSNDPAASVTVTDLVDADIKVHKDGAATPLTTDGATVTIDLNSIPGSHMVTIDTSVHSDYSTGSDYQVKVEGITVDAGTLNPWIGSFSIQNRYSATAIDAVKAETALIVADTNELQSDDVPGLIATLDAVVDTVKVDTAAILVDTGTTIPASLTTIDNEIAAIDAVVDAVLVDTGTTLPATLATIDGIVDSILVDTGTTIPATITTIDNEIAVIDGIVDAILVDTGTTIPATITTAQNDLDIITGASGVNLLTATQASIDAIEADTNELQADDVPGLIATLDAVVDTVKAETALIVADTNELQTDDVPGLIATLDAVVDTVKVDTAAILVDTGTTLDGKINTIDGIVDSILVDTDTTIPGLIAGLDDPTAAAIATAVVDKAVEGAITVEGALRIMLSALSGKLNGAATTTVNIRDLADAKNRIVATVDADGNRSAVTLDVTD